MQKFEHQRLVRLHKASLARLENQQELVNGQQFAFSCQGPVTRLQMAWWLL
jgi:hypothetical protein